jgi:hypothetical protein
VRAVSSSIEDLNLNLDIRLFPGHANQLAAVAHLKTIAIRWNINGRFISWFTTALPLCDGPKLIRK